MYNILPKFVNSSIQIIQIDSRHLLSYYMYMPISLVYNMYYTGVFCDIWILL